MSFLSISMAVFNLQVCLCMIMARCIKNKFPDLENVHDSYFTASFRTVKTVISV